MTDRRQVLHGFLGLTLLGTASTPRAAPPDEPVLKALRQGGVVVAFRHADAPGNFDPPGFKLGECGTQRNLGELGRAQAGRIGAWFREQRLTPRRVRSSPWCRCVDTARLAFGEVETWDSLSSTIGAPEPAVQKQVAAMRLVVQALPKEGFEVWVSHQTTLGALAGESTSSGEALLLRPHTGGANGGVQVIGRFSPG